MSCKIHNNSGYDISEMKPLVRNLYSFAKDRFEFKKPPSINFVSDQANHPMLGKTAHYDPSSMEVTIYADGRHPKDMMRSIAHELVHHFQNEKGNFDSEHIAGEGYAQKDPHLRKMEEEAYLEGNMCFRDWEDQYKTKNKDIFYERRIYKMSTKKWKNKELNTLLNERWGFSMNLDKLNEGNRGIYKPIEDITDIKEAEEIYNLLYPMLQSYDPSDDTEWASEKLNKLIDKFPALVDDRGVYSEGAKPDFIDIDKDGDKEESMKDAAEEAEVNELKIIATGEDLYQSSPEPDVEEDEEDSEEETEKLEETGKSIGDVVETNPSLREPIQAEFKDLGITLKSSDIDKIVNAVLKIVQSNSTTRPATSKVMATAPNQEQPEE